MGIAIPQTLAQWAQMAPFIATLLIGLIYFLAPARSLSALGLEGAPGHPEAFGEGRSSFAGFLLGTGICGILFGQPVLLSILGLAYLLTVAGKAIHIAVDGARGWFVLARLGLAAGLAVLAFSQAPVPDLSLALPSTSGEWLVAVTAGATLLLGLSAVAAPRVVMTWLRLAARADRPDASGELRGTLACFYLAVGYSAFTGTGIFVELVLGAAWLSTAFGRMISMLSDRANNAFNWLFLSLELSLAALPLSHVFGLLP